MAEVASQPFGQEGILLPSPLATIPAEYSGDFLLSDMRSPMATVSQRAVRICEQGGFVMHPNNRQGDCMGLQVRTDEETGLPLPLIITDQYHSKQTNAADFHHLFYPHRIMRRQEALYALRTSYGQHIPRGLHERFHKFFAGSKLPQSRDETFRLCVLACAGVVPRQAVDLSHAVPKVRDATEEEYAQIVAAVKREGLTRKNGGKAQCQRIGNFFTSYALEQSIEQQISPKVIDEFLHTRDWRRQRALGNFMLSVAVDVSVDPIKPLYNDLQKEGLFKGKPLRPEKVVKRYFTTSHLSVFQASLRKQLATVA